MEVKLTGTLVAVFDTEEKNSHTTRKAVIRIDEYTQYPQEVLFETYGVDKCKLLDGVSKAVVSCNLKGRSWTNKEGVQQWFNTLSMWKIEVTEKSPF